jgi:peptide/nickel transport system permease protein
MGEGIQFLPRRKPMGNPILRAAVFFARRLLGNLGSVLVIVTLLFLALWLGPAGLSAVVQRGPLPREILARLDQHWGAAVDQPLPVQYANFTGRMLIGDFGPAFSSRTRSVNEITGSVMPNTLKLWGAAVLFSLLPSLLILGLGLLVLWLRGRVPLLGNGLRRLGQWIASGWLLVPVLATTVVLWVILAVELRIFPVARMAESGADLAEEFKYLFLPALSLAILPAYLVARSVAGEFAHYADRRNIREALPIVLLIGNAASRLVADGLIQGIGILGGILLIELLFAWTGIGRFLSTAVVNHDIPVMLGAAMNILWIALALRLLSDLFRAVSLGLSAWLDGKVEEPEPRPVPALDKVLGIVWVVIAVLLVLLPLVVGLGGAFVAPYDPTPARLTGNRLPPSAEHLLGTDPLGRDILSRLLHAMRLDLGTAIGMTLAAFIPAALGGLLAGFLARRRTVWADVLDGLVMFPAEALVALPGLVLLIMVSVNWMIAGRGAEEVWKDWLAMAIYIVALYMLPRMMHMIREGTASVSLQGGTGWIVLRLAGVIGAALLAAPGLGLFALVAVEFLGLGILPPHADLGGMVRTGLLSVRVEEWHWSVLAPTFAIVFLSGGWFLLAETVLSKVGMHKRESWLDVNR